MGQERWRSRRTGAGEEWSGQRRNHKLRARHRHGYTRVMGHRVSVLISAPRASMPWSPSNMGHRSRYPVIVNKIPPPSSAIRRNVKSWAAAALFIFEWEDGSRMEPWQVHPQGSFLIRRILLYQIVRHFCLIGQKKLRVDRWIHGSCHGFSFTFAAIEQHTHAIVNWK